METTTDEFAKRLGVEKIIGYGFLRFLEAAGVVENLGARKGDGLGKGKRPSVYKLPPDLKEKVGELMDKLS